MIGMGKFQESFSTKGMSKNEKKDFLKSLSEYYCYGFTETGDFITAKPVREGILNDELFRKAHEERWGKCDNWNCKYIAAGGQKGLCYYHFQEGYQKEQELLKKKKIRKYSQAPKETEKTKPDVRSKNEGYEKIFAIKSLARKLKNAVKDFWV